jgi:hypothetical protein
MKVHRTERRVLFSYHHGMMDEEAGVIIMRSFMAALLSPTPTDITNAYPTLEYHRAATAASSRYRYPGQHFCKS